MTAGKTNRAAPRRRTRTRPETPKTAAETPQEAVPWELRLYVAGSTAKSREAFENLKRICDEHLTGQFHIEVVDLLKNPKLAKGDQIVAVPTLVRRLPEPVRKIIGRLSDTDKVLVGLQLRPRGMTPL